MLEKVYGFLANKCKTEVYSKKDFAVITHDCKTSGGTAFIQMPDGFMASNSVIISVMRKITGVDFNTWESSNVIELEEGSGNLVNSVPCQIYLDKADNKERISLMQMEKGYTYKIVLMRTDL